MRTLNLCTWLAYTRADMRLRGRFHSADGFEKADVEHPTARN